MNETSKESLISEGGDDKKSIKTAVAQYDSPDKTSNIFDQQNLVPQKTSTEPSYV